MVSKQFQFSCACGALLAAERRLAGRQGKCQGCGAVFEIPQPGVLSTAPRADAIAVQEVCGICQTAIAEDDPRTLCQACDLPYHAECWVENLGCAAYGCSQVNVLKVGPDIRIPSPASPLPGSRQPGFPQAGQSPLGASGYQGGALPSAVDRAAASPTLAWDYLWMGASAVGVFLSILSYGGPSAVTGLAALVAYAFQQDKSHWGPAATSLLLSAVGVVFGLRLSLLFWQAT
ncbi:hypothetical protein Pla8534_08030 [Lignipirellula cremea]|uniref:Uncharacterized protein n=2 Tax=Lignipirellula cremea TaxID=2528010 RepID=A0A518DMG2_9BACT|nr:hypothetical protein Pla8534_08030 [Lignipirellula cremea]